MHNFNEIINFITEQQELDIISLVPSQKSKATSKRNSVIRFGCRHPYDGGWRSEVIPDVFKSIVMPNNYIYNSVSINEYLPGQTINHHIDSEDAGDKIFILNLLSVAFLEFKRGDKVLSFELKPRSLYTLEGELRWKWTHGLTAVEKRYSVVFRNSKNIIKNKKLKI